MGHFVKGNEASLRHGHSKRGKISPEYIAWRAMHRRCSDVNWPQWKDYGGRGIRVCERWRSFENFLSDMGPRPPGQRGKRGLYSVDRFPNPDGNYEPGNTRWATRKEQVANRRKKAL